MSDTPTRRKPPPRLNRALAAHQRRARIIAQLHAQAIATANDDLAAQRKVIGANTAKDAAHGKAEAWFGAVAFLLALGGIVAAGCVLAAMVPWQ
jgi:hypothetical protein